MFLRKAETGISKLSGYRGNSWALNIITLHFTLYTVKCTCTLLTLTFWWVCGACHMCGVCMWCVLGADVVCMWCVRGAYVVRMWPYLVHLAHCRHWTQSYPLCQALALELVCSTLLPQNNTLYALTQTLSGRGLRPGISV